jgi:hypothetical protein
MTDRVFGALGNILEKGAASQASGKPSAEGPQLDGLDDLDGAFDGDTGAHLSPMCLALGFVAVEILLNFWIRLIMRVVGQLTPQAPNFRPRQFAVFNHSSFVASPSIAAEM